MKRNLKVLIVNVLTIILFTNFSPLQSSDDKSNAPVILNTSPQFANYVWYTDEEMTEMTGTYSDINVEINRLILLFPGYTFSSYHMSGLYEYEYGHNPSLPTSIIYSNL